MIYLISIAFVIGLSVWLWGEQATKRTIKWMLGSVAGLVVVAVVALMAQEAKHAQIESAQESVKLNCNTKEREAYDSRPECPRYIVTAAQEDANNCRINWDLQNDLGIKSKAAWEASRITLDARC